MGKKEGGRLRGCKGGSTCYALPLGLLKSERMVPINPYILFLLSVVVSPMRVVARVSLLLIQSLESTYVTSEEKIVGTNLRNEMY